MGYKTIDFGEHTAAELRTFLEDIPDHARIYPNHSAVEMYGVTELVAEW